MVYTLKICVEMPQHIQDGLCVHVGVEWKFVNLSDAVGTACRKILDGMDEIDRIQGRTLARKKRER